MVNGHADESTLDSYDAERLPVMRALLESVKAQCVLQFNFDESGLTLKRRMAEQIIPLPDVQRKLVLELCGLEAPYPHEAGNHALTGCRLPDFDLLTLDGRSLRPAELLRDRKFLLLDLEGQSRQFEALQCAGLPLNVVSARVGRVPAEMDGVTGILVRPDGYVAWASSALARAGEVEAQLGRWLTRSKP
ncbi:hypothetical protein D3C72_1804080 [compost metagenome]